MLRPFFGWMDFEIMLASPKSYFVLVFLILFKVYHKLPYVGTCSF